MLQFSVLGFLRIVLDTVSVVGKYLDTLHFHHPGRPHVFLHSVSFFLYSLFSNAARVVANDYQYQQTNLSGVNFVSRMRGKLRSVAG